MQYEIRYAGQRLTVSISCAGGVDGRGMGDHHHGAFGTKVDIVISSMVTNHEERNVGAADMSQDWNVAISESKEKRIIFGNFHAMPNGRSAEPNSSNKIKVLFQELIEWTWQSPDRILIKSPLRWAMTGSNPIDRSKLGTERHVLIDREGIPLSVVISSASMHDIKLATDVVDGPVVKRCIPYAKTKEDRKRNCNTYVLIKHIIPSPKNRQLKNEDM